jgi:hypothetical protein
MQLLKHIIANERPDLINAYAFEFKEVHAATVPGALHLGSKERDIIESVKQLPPLEREKVYAIIRALLRTIGRKGRKPNA